MGDADLRRSLLGRPSPTRSTAPTWRRDRPVCRWPSTCRRRPATTRTIRWRAARSARSASRSRTSATCARCSPTSRSTGMNTSMTINATGDVAARALPGGRRGAEPRPRAPRGGPPAGRDHPERHHQGVPLARHLRVPAGALAAPDHRHDRLHGQRDPEVEPDQHLQLPPAGGRRHARAGAGLRAVHRDRRARRGARTPARSAEDDFGEVVGRISFFVNAGVRFVEEMCKMRAFVQLWDEITRERYGVHGREACGASATACRSTRSG